MSVVIEFFGMPGAGKTFLARHLIRHLGEHRFCVSDRAVRLAAGNGLSRVALKVVLLMRALMFDRECLQPVLALTQSCGIAGGGRKLKILVNWLYLCALIRRECKRYPVVVLDQGLAQALWSSLFHGVTQPQGDTVVTQFEHLFAQLGVDRLQVFQLQAAENVIASRIESRQRGKSPLDGGSRDDWSRAAWVTRETRSLIDAVASRDPAIRIDDMCNQTDGIDQLDLDRIREMIGGGSKVPPTSP